MNRLCLCLCLLLAGCSQSPASSTPAPSPTIASVALPAADDSAPIARTQRPQPTATAAPLPTPAPIIADTPTTPFAYLWPAVIPEGMQMSARESRVAQTNESGVNGVGFYIITFANRSQKLVVGGGSTRAFPLAGEEQTITVAGKAARMISSGDQHQVVIEQPQGIVFVYGFGIPAEAVQQTAESLQPITIDELRSRVPAASP